MSEACCAPSAETDRPTPRQASVSLVRTKAVGRAPKGMVHIPGGRFLMGTDDSVGFAADGEGPVREIEVSPFLIDDTAVTNAQFGRFVRQTRYKTEAERYGWSFVFHSFVPRKDRQNSYAGGRGSALVVAGGWRLLAQARGSRLGNRSQNGPSCCPHFMERRAGILPVGRQEAAH